MENDAVQVRKRCANCGSLSGIALSYGPSKASGDRLQIPGDQARWEQTQKFQHGSNFLKKKNTLWLITDSHSIVVEQPAIEPKEKTPDDTSANTRDFALAERSKRPNKRKLIGKPNFPNIFPMIRSAKCASSRKVLYLRAGTSWMHEETVSIYR